MIEVLQLRGLSERTQESYVRAVRQLAAHSHKAPARITAEELRDYFLYLKNVKHYSRSASTIALCGIKFFYEQTLKRNWPTLTFVRASQEKKLPVILSVAEVRTILAHLNLLRYRVCLTTIYSCGLRLQEGTHLQVPEIDSARMLVHVRHGKGAKDRYVPLPSSTLELLRQYWKTHRHPLWLFPAPGRGGIGMSTASAPLPLKNSSDASSSMSSPKGFIKVRYYGFLSPACRPALSHIRQRLAAATCQVPAPHDAQPPQPHDPHAAAPSARQCTRCGGQLVLIQHLAVPKRAPP